jgi:hypothetical protein
MSWREGASLDHEDPEMLLFSMTRFLAEEQRQVTTKES